MKRLSQIHPIFYHARIKQKRLFRHLSDLGKGFASEQTDAKLEYTCKKHQSLLRRRLGNSDPQLQENKVKNLRIACPTIDGLLIKPGETFSFWRQLGEATVAASTHCRAAARVAWAQQIGRRCVSLGLRSKTWSRRSCEVQDSNLQHPE